MRTVSRILVLVVMLLVAWPAAADAATWKVGDNIEVEWKGSWYRSEILAVKDGKYQIHYTGWDKKWDEWVTPARMRAVAAWKVGDRCEVEWKGTWYASEILAIKDGKYQIHYTGWDKKWDEWVPLARMRAPVPK